MEVMGKLCFLVYRSTGSWDSYHQWVDRVFNSREKAEALISKKNYQIARLKNYSREKAEDYDHPQWLRHIRIMDLGEYWIEEKQIS